MKKKSIFGIKSHILRVWGTELLSHYLDRASIGVCEMKTICKFKLNQPRRIVTDTYTYQTFRNNSLGGPSTRMYTITLECPPTSHYQINVCANVCATHTHTIISISARWTGTSLTKHITNKITLLRQLHQDSPWISYCIIAHNTNVANVPAIQPVIDCN